MFSSLNKDYVILISKHLNIHNNIFRIVKKIMVQIKLSELKFSKAEQMTIDDVRAEHKDIGSRCNRLLNALFEGARIGNEIPAIQITADFDVIDGYHREACLRFMNAEYPDEYHFDSIECEII
jgi:hypothetical protein